MPRRVNIFTYYCLTILPYAVKSGWKAPDSLSSFAPYG